MTDEKRIGEDVKCTSHQETVLKHLKRFFNRYHSPREEEYEIKRWELSQFTDSSSIFLNVSIGLKKDEGTLASILGRDKWHLWIGARGAIRVCEEKKGKTIWRPARKLEFNY